METSYPLQTFSRKIECLYVLLPVAIDLDSTLQFGSIMRHHYVYTLGYKNDYVCVYTINIWM